MTLSEFRATGVDVVDLASHERTRDQFYGSPLTAGRVYSGDCWIEKLGDHWLCVIANDSREGTLVDCEAYLHEWAVDELELRVACPPRPGASQVARRYCLILDEVLTRADMSKLHRANCVPGDLCDDNMAMCEAIASEWGQSEEAITPADQETTDIWNAAYALALAANFKAGQVAS